MVKKGGSYKHHEKKENTQGGMKDLLNEDKTEVERSYQKEKRTMIKEREYIEKVLMMYTRRGLKVENIRHKELEKQMPQSDMMDEIPNTNKWHKVNKIVDKVVMRKED
ncbi:hypothetical protein C2G38_2047367 [Gigaspora rosea]|uniref:Uncharacterized protein n=1 Tax=Gigaspora rosea TaxID=44941 RepID=A0A397U629_9GLOM|nr:hypothetical protein C2G38_2047367 [Gigaspora rosea]